MRPTGMQCLDFVLLTLNVLLTTQIIEYCEHHRGEPLPNKDAKAQDETSKRKNTEISEWDQKFLAADQEMLFDICCAANYLDIKSLLSVLMNRTP
jgi:hypothetical protein